MLRLCSLLGLFFLVLGAAWASEPTILSATAANGQVSFPNENPPRFLGTTVNLLLTFSEAVATPDITKISLTGTDPNTAAISAVTNSNGLLWVYSATVTTDGVSTLTIAAGCTSRLSDATHPSLPFATTLVLDTVPVLSIPAPSVAGNVMTFIITLVSGRAATETSNPWNDSLVTVNNGAVTSETSTANTLTITVAPYGYGTVTLNALAGLASDAYGNVSAALSSSGILNGPGSAPYVLQVVGLSPDNMVYRTGDSLDIAVDFTNPIKIQGGNPFLKLNSGSATNLALASYTGSANNGSRLIFHYVVGADHRSVALDVSGTDALIIPDQSALTGTGTPIDWLANTTLPAPGATGSLSANSFYSINVEAAKPNPSDIVGADQPKACGVGSGIGLLLGGGSLALLMGRRRRG
jgi:hypothetical protein